MYTSSSARAFCAFLFLIVAAQCNAQNLTTSAPTSPSQVQVEGDPRDIYYDVGRELAVRCDLQRADGQDIVWKKNGTVLSENERLKFSEQSTVLRYARSQEDDYGPYSCVVGDRERAFYARGRPRIKLPANSNVVEGQNLRLTCKVIGRPYPVIDWLFSNDTMKNISVNEVLGLRAAINVSDQGVVGGELLLREVLRSEAGNYTCYIVTEYPDGHLDNSTTIVRVKDKYAALWPFLGICIEVFVLCAIILVYEKRRTKPELDDSDTDNHDQKKS